MAKIWNPGAQRTTVRQFVDRWCITEKGQSAMGDVLFGAYETFCRLHHLKDLTHGEFSSEMEVLGFAMHESRGVTRYEGLRLALMDDSRVGRRYGARPTD